MINIVYMSPLTKKREKSTKNNKTKNPEKTLDFFFWYNPKILNNPKIEATFLIQALKIF